MCIRDRSKGCAGSGETGEWRDKMNKTHPGWGDIMRNKIVPKAARYNNRSITDKHN